MKLEESAQPPSRPAKELSPAEELTESQIESLPDAAAGNPEDFLKLVSGMQDEDPWVLTLVDKSHPLPDDFSPPDLVALKEFPDIPLNKSDIQLSRLAAESLSVMCRDAADEGLRLGVSSAYRSWDYQKGLFERYAAQDGVEAASRYSARPGESQHQMGTTVDFGDISNAFSDTDEGLWLQENAWRYGWSLSYPRGAETETGYVWESWHWRYVGESAAQMQKDFFDGSQQAMLEYWAENRDIFKAAGTD